MFTSAQPPLTVALIVDQFRQAGMTVEPEMVSATRLREAVNAAIRQRPYAIVVGGGDGSISTAAQSLAGTGIPLGVLPLGTLNHFLRDLGLPPDWREAVSVIAHGQRRAVDVGEVNGRVFINNCSLGAYAEAVRRREALRRRRDAGKWWAMLLATITVFRRLRRIRVRLAREGSTLPLRTPFVVVSNNRYSGRVLDYSLRPRVDEGRLWIYSTRAHRHGTLLRLMWQSLLRNIDDVDGLDQIETIAATIDHDYERLHLAVDGELVDLRPPLHFRTRPLALQVLAPARSQAGT